MSHADDIIKLRKRVLDAVTAGVVDANLKSFYEATLLQILNESERQRQVCAAQAESFRKQAAVADGQASAYSAMGSIVYNVLNSYILQEERAKREEMLRAEEEKNKAEYAEALRKKQEQIDKENGDLESEEVEDTEDVEEEPKVKRSRRGKKTT